MKAKVTKFIAALVAVFALTLPAHAQNKIAVVDLKKVFDTYYRTRIADTQLKDSAADLDKLRKGMIDEYQKSNEDFKKLLEGINDPSIGAEEKDKRRKEAEKKQGEIREQENSIRTFDNNSRQGILEKQKRLRDSVLRDIRGVVEEKSKAAGYNLVFDVAAESVNQTPVLIYNSLVGGPDDLTEPVLKQLNANAPAETPKAEDKKDEKKDDKK
jgi:Skp family chaperone for outer membrane proteins